jgi:hypothetical protein
MGDLQTELHKAGPPPKDEAAKAKPLNRQAEMHLRNPNNHFALDPTGHIHVFKDKQSMENFKSEAGIQ